MPLAEAPTIAKLSPALSVKEAPLTAGRLAAGGHTTAFSTSSWPTGTGSAVGASWAGRA